jgi:hypothetical protein
MIHENSRAWSQPCPEFLSAVENNRVITAGRGPCSCRDGNKGLELREPKYLLEEVGS